MKALLQRAPQLALDPQQPSPVRRAAIEALGLAAYTDAAPTLLTILESKQPETLQLAAIATLNQFPEAQVGSDLINRHPDLSPAARGRALDAVLQRPERLDALWLALEQKTISPADLSARHRDLLRKHRPARA